MMGSPVKIIFDKGYRLLRGRARQADAKCIAAKSARIVLGIACCVTKRTISLALQDQLWVMQLPV